MGTPWTALTTLDLARRDPAAIRRTHCLRRSVGLEVVSTDVRHLSGDRAAGPGQGF